jgi:hypothetical protein
MCCVVSAQARELDLVVEVILTILMVNHISGSVMEV